ncbi:MAG: amidohydrolase family protein [bacterium]|jgi:dihydropyrimidinase|nr:amidohydrolase family protein [bacterium]
MLDRVVRGGQVVTPEGVGTWDVGIAGERIAAVAAPGSLTEDAGEVIDATGKIVVPGGIDPHIHARWALPDAEGHAHAFSADPDHVSKAALFGGTTTWIDFAMWESGQTLEQAIEQRDAQWRGCCHSDYAFHVMLQGSVPPAILEQIPEVIQAGFPSVKIFTTDITPSRRGRKLLFGDIWEVLQVLARHGGIAAVHAEDDDLVMHMYEKLAREGRTGFEHMPEVHTTLSEDLAFRRVIRLAEHIEGAALYLMHTSSATGALAIADARARGFPIYGETLHHYALYSAEAYLRPNGQIYHTYPSLKSREDTRELWRGMAGGAIQTIATDGICTSLEVKIKGRKIDDTTGGNAGVEPRMGIMFTEAVAQRGYSLPAFVDLTSANAARILGLYPQKGALAVGSDADIVLIDPLWRRPLRTSDLHETDYSPWEGWDVAGWPVTTLLRGKVVVADGEFRGSPSDGRLVKRRVADGILSGPAGGR